MALLPEFLAEWRLLWRGLGLEEQDREAGGGEGDEAQLGALQSPGILFMVLQDPLCPAVGWDGRISIDSLPLGSSQSCLVFHGHH